MIQVIRYRAELLTKLHVAHIEQSVLPKFYVFIELYVMFFNDV